MVKGGLEEIDLRDVLGLLERDVRFITDMVGWQLSTPGVLETYLDYDGNITQPNTLGRTLGFTLPADVLKGFMKGKSGLSRYEFLFQDRLVRELSSWAERYKAVNNESSKYISQGWKRTADGTRPTDLIPEYHLSAVNKQFAYVNNNPVVDGEIRLRIIINGSWHELRFPFDNKRFGDCRRVTLPNVRVSGGRIVFDFTAEYEYIYRAFSDRYIVGVDVGKTTYATAVVYDRETENVAHVYVMSRRACSLQNSITATEKQISHLHKHYGADCPEIPLQRASLSNKRRELAILVAQEIADIAEVWDNAVIAVEDLSWVKNTMQNGRWNRGGFVSWLEHFHALNGGRLIKVNAYNTSQECPHCHGKVLHPRWKDSYCGDCGVLWDRDVAAAIIIAQRAVKTVEKCIATRGKSKKLTCNRCRRTPVTRQTLKYPGRDRTKNKPTSKRPLINRKHWREYSLFVKNRCSAYCSDDRMVYADGTRLGSARTLEKQHDNDSTVLLL